MSRDRAQRRLDELAAEQCVGPVVDPAAWLAAVTAPADIPADDLEAWASAIRSGGSVAELVEAARADERSRIAAALDQAAGFYDHPEIWPAESQHPEAVGARAMRTAYRIAARLIRQRQLPGDEPGNDDKEP